METDTQIKPEITEQEVVNFIVNNAAKLKSSVGELYCHVALGISHHSEESIQVHWTTYVHGDCHRTASTINEAMLKSIKAMNPDIRANDLREKARKMLEEADALAATP